MYFKLGLLLVLCGLCVESRKFFRGKLFGEDVVSWDGYQRIRDPPAQEMWFDQILDHFDPTNNATWKQRYYINKDHYGAGGPVFLMIGGEAPISAKWMNQGTWVQYAVQHHAMLIQVEHRFYGKSRPTKGVTTEELVHLSSENALADLAYFITEMKIQLNMSGDYTRWISFGGSYPGSLSAWLREKYPHLVHGAISSSGPLLAKVDFKEYFDVVVTSLETNSDTCVQAVKRSIDEVDVLLKHMIGQRSITEKFKLCNPIEENINNNLDVQSLFENLSSLFAGIVQYSGTPRARYSIDDVCNVMRNTSMGTPLDRLAQVNSMIMEDQGEKCLDYKYDNMISELRATNWDADGVINGTRSWTYQTCTEFGFYQTSDNASLVFGNHFPVDFFIKQCSDIFGPKFDALSLNRSILHTNVNYGALNPATTNVLYVNGNLDPWHALGLTKSSNDAMPTILISGTAHCANMYEPRSIDLPQLKKAREQIDNFITGLLKRSWHNNY